jgi:hypothetical protein
MDGAGNVFLYRARFSALLQTGLVAHSTSYTTNIESLSLEYSDRGVALTTHHPSNAGVKERVELYNYTSIPPLGLYCLF